MNKNTFPLIGGLLLSVLFFPLVLAAQETDTVALSTDLGVQISTRPEAKVSLTQSFTFPFLQGDGPMTKDNNIKLSATAEVSPISLNGLGEVLWSPAAFLQAAVGGRIGSGWNIDLFGGKIYGIGLNERGDNNKEVISGDAFDSMMWRVYGGAALQFDLAAVVPGDWNHILFRAYNEGRYSAYNRAGAGDSWVFQNDEAQNRNGWMWYGSYVLGYQMPLSPVLDTVAFMAEFEKNLYNTSGGDIWGDDLPRWIFSALFNFNITPRFSAALALQLRTLRNYGSSDLENQDHIYYQDLILDDTYGKQRLVFYRAALIMSYKIR
jgi:hypothetical protein